MNIKDNAKEENEVSIKLGLLRLWRFIGNLETRHNKNTAAGNTNWL